jgi:hypothetical protein
MFILHVFPSTKRACTTAMWRRFPPTAPRISPRTRARVGVGIAYSEASARLGFARASVAFNGVQHAVLQLMHKADMPLSNAPLKARSPVPVYSGLVFLKNSPESIHGRPRSHRGA